VEIARHARWEPLLDEAGDCTASIADGRSDNALPDNAARCHSVTRRLQRHRSWSVLRWLEFECFLRTRTQCGVERL
jgi:hypothetical protein